MYKGTILKSTANEIGTMLNSKLGVITGFKPSEWAGAINLLAKCPEKTVSGSIVSITDGANGVPLKNCICTIPASLTGVTNIDVTHTGKNVLDMFAYSTSLPLTTNGITFSKNEDGTVHAEGTATSTAYWNVTFTSWYNAMPITEFIGTNLKFTTIKIGGTGTVNSGSTAVFKADSTYYTSNLQPVPSDAVGLRGFISISNGSTVDLDFAVQLEVGSTATAYEAYNGSTDTISLGQTVYGGTVDVVTGTMVLDRQIITFDGSNDEDWRKYTEQATQVVSFRLPIEGKAMEELSSLCNNFTNIKNCWTKNDNGVFSDHKSQNNLFFRPLTDDITELTQWRAWLADNPTTVCYKLAEPVTVQITPIQMATFEGGNTIFNRSGDTSVTYRRDPTLALAQYENAPLLMMMAPMLMSNNEESEVNEDGNDIQE